MTSSPANGGWPARGAVIRWASRLLRREWRQHLLILGLLTVAVAGATRFSCAIYNVASADGDSEFGDGNHIFGLEQPDPSTLPGDLERARARFGAIDVIGHRAVPVPGSVTSVVERAQDPDGPFGGPMLGLLAGRYPASGDEVALTDGVRELLGTSFGATVSLGGRVREVVGLVENPAELDDEFALVPPSELAGSESVEVIVRASDDLVDGYDFSDSVRMISSRDEVPEDVVAGVAALVLGTLVLLLVALIAAASFTVIAQRRLPQLGMLAAVGATEKHLRLTMLAGGAVTGAVAATLGAGLGLTGWLVLEPRMESAAGHRIDPSNIPWWLVLVVMALAVAAASGAAWWPGRTVSRISPVLALSGRPPGPAALHRSAAVAVGVLAAGIACIHLGGRDIGGQVSGGEMVLLGAGTVGLVVGVSLLSPLAVRALARLAGRVPVGPRVALRDLGRYQARSGAAIAAIGLALGIPVIVVAVAAADRAGPANLPANQLLVGWDERNVPFAPEGDQLAALEAGVGEVASTLSGAQVIRLDVARDPAVARDPTLPGVESIMLGWVVEDGFEGRSLLYVATPDLLAALGLDADDVLPSDDVVTTGGRLESVLLGGTGADGPAVEDIATPGGLPPTHSSLPQALIAADRVSERGWEIVPSGSWLFETSEPLAGRDLSRARDVAARHDLVIETRDDEGGRVQLRFGAVSVGLLLALGIVAMTVGLIRAESSGEMRTLTATGAGRATRRNITATTAAALAAVGAVLGIVGVYAGLAVGQVPNLFPPPAVDLAAIAVGLPFAAAAGGWLVAGREPAGLARRPIE
jgi:putative ABC transport system permease protein